MKYKILSILITFSLTLTMLVGCVGGGQGGGSFSSQSKQSSSNLTYERFDVNINVVGGNQSASSSSSGSYSGSNSNSISGAISSSSNENGENSSSQGGSSNSQTSLKDVLRTIRSSVVEVYATISQKSTLVGSGVVIALTDQGDKTRSCIVTCYHSLESAEAVSIRTIDGVEYDATFVGADPDTDICVMMVNSKLECANLYDTKNLEVGERVVAIGNPYGLVGGSVSNGIISAICPSTIIENKSYDLLQTDAVVNSNDSGAGLFTESGYLVGLVDTIYAKKLNSNINGLNFVIPSSTIIDISTQLITTYTGEKPGYIAGKYLLGCSVANKYLNAWMSQSYVYVTKIDTTGSMYKGGLREGDRLVSYYWNRETVTITTADKFVEDINSIDFKIGDVIELNIIRNETNMNLKIEIRQYICGEE